MTHGEYRAYPVPEDSRADGLTKRELFAAMAMQGILSGYLIELLQPTRAQIAEAAVLNADALIAELNEEVRS